MLDNTNSGVVLLTRIIAIIIYLCAFIVGIAFGTEESNSIFQDTERDFQIGIAIIFWVAGLISGSLFIWMAEVLKQLRKINGTLLRDNISSRNDD